MKLHEYQSKALLQSAGVPVPRGTNVHSASKVPEALREMGLTAGVIKAQAFTGGRGKAGGIKFFENEEQAVMYAEKMIGMTLVTHQTGPDGVKIHSVLLAEPTDIARELYVAFLLDRAKINPVIMISPDGGMDIEEVAAKTPERILHLYPPFNEPIPIDMIDQAAEILGLEGNLKEQFADIMQRLYQVYLDRDATLLEVNPLVVTPDNRITVLDCKFDVDDNAIWRQLDSGGDPNAEKTPSEIEAAKFGMSYISLDGSIGCMVNGAGLAMATMDSIKHYGGEPANFLDVGGSATEEAVTHAFEIISSDHAVDCILVNIFGGIMKCDTIANGIVAAVNKIGLKVPLVVRLEGTNVDLGKEIIANSGLNIINASSLDDAAKKAVSVITKNK
jgi:succinyl-CoA synthetase beta subunit